VERKQSISQLKKTCISRHTHTQVAAPTKKPSKKQTTTRGERNPRHHKDGNSFQVVVPFKKPSTRKNKNKRQQQIQDQREGIHKA
jgi:hypothetical protein